MDTVSPEIEVSPTSAIAVKVHAARLAFGEELLFDDLDFTLEAGRWTCLLGPSGVGKTSLLRVIADLAPAASGTRISCSDGGSLRGRAAYMAQQDLLLPWLDLVDNALIGPRLRGQSRDSALRTRAINLLERVGLASHLYAPPHACSGGMRQRAALVRTLIEDRPVVLMDEPFSSLDAITRVRLQDLAARLLLGRTVLLVTHDPMEALRLGHRIHVMSGKPARLDAALTPAGEPPRDLRDPRVTEAYGSLLARLVAAGGAA